MLPREVKEKRAGAGSHAFFSNLSRVIPYEYSRNADSLFLVRLKLAFHAKDLKTEYLEIFNVFKIWIKSNPVAVLYFPFVFLDKCSSRKDEQKRVKICYLVDRF